MSKYTIKNFLIINFTGKNDYIGLKKDNNFFIQKIQTNNMNNDIIVISIFDFLKKYNITLNETFSIIVNQGPGRFSAIRSSLAVAKGLKIAKKIRLYGYKDELMIKFNLQNIEFLIKKNLLENKLIKPVYLS
tara:strand:+ start:110 stop:505 length:396 start_codon:yes stop_codon:yes gene_type:complete